MSCDFDVMLSMTTHSENLTGVQQELWHLIHDEDMNRVLEAMIKKMKKVEDSFECIKQWRQEAEAYIPDDQKYDENYWVVAYILYTNVEYLKDLFKEFDELDNIRQELSKLKDELNELNQKKEKLEERIENLLREIDNCEKDLEDVEVTYGEKLRRLSRLEGKRYHHLLPEIIKLAKQLVAS